MAAVRTIRFYGSDTDLWHVVTTAGDTASDTSAPLPPPQRNVGSFATEVHIPIVRRLARACVSFEGWKTRTTASTSTAVDTNLRIPDDPQDIIKFRINISKKKNERIFPRKLEVSRDIAIINVKTTYIFVHNIECVSHVLYI